MRNNFVFVLSALVVAAASAPLQAQTGIPNLDKGMNILKRLEQRAASAPTRQPAPEPGPAQAPAEVVPVAPGSGAKLDLDSDPAQSQAKSSEATLRSRPTLDVDVAGVRLGMSIEEARASLKKRNPNYEFRVLEVQFPPPGAKRFVGALHGQHIRKRLQQVSITSAEAVLVTVSGPPNSPTVLGIARHEVFQGEEPNADQFVAALIQKFGEPDIADQHRSDFYWYLDLPKPLRAGKRDSCGSGPGGFRTSGAISGKSLVAPLENVGVGNPQLTVDYLSQNHPALSPSLDAHYNRPVASCGRVVRAQLTRTGPQQGLLMWYQLSLFDFTSTYKNMADLRRQVLAAKEAEDKGVISESEVRKKPTF